MATDLIFLKALRDKLKGGNAKSIHLNVLPGRFATRLDLANFNYIHPDYAKKFLDALLTMPCFDFKISFDGIDLSSIQSDEQKRLGLLSKRLNSLYIENEDNYKEHGIKTFGFGFPILVKPSKQDPKKIIKAPLFIWQLEIIKATNKVNTWSILRNKTRNENGKIVDEEVHSVGLNEVLLSFLKTDENILVPQINEELLEDAVINKRELIDECYKVLKALNANAATNIKETLQIKFNEPLKNIPEAISLESVSGNIPWIHFGGVFGLFRTQKESIINDIDKIIDKFDDFDFENLKVESFSGTAHSAVETDPSQQEILTTLGIEPKKIIQGPPGTGKTQSLSALITNALANNLKVLVVCEKRTAMEAILKKLNETDTQLASLVALIEDVNSQRDGIINSVRDRLNNMSQHANFNQLSYTNVRQAVEEKAEELNQQHKQLDKKIYQGKSWTELVGEFLKRQKVADFAELKTKLDYKQFKFEKEEKELSEIVSKIKIAKKLYADVERLDHPLEILSDEVFKQHNPRAIQLKLEEISKDTTNNLEEVKAELQRQLSEYQKWLDSHFGEYYHEVKKQIKSYKEFVVFNHDQFGELFFKNDGFTKFRIQTFSIVSNRYKTLKSNRFTLVNQVSEIKHIHQTLKYFEHTYIEGNHTPTLKIFAENIDKLNEHIDEWFKNNEKVKQDYLQNFSSNYLHPIFTDKETLRNTERNFEQIISTLKDEKLLKRTLAGTKNHNQKISESETLLSEMKIISENLENSPLQRTVVTSIIEINCKNWETTFESWYYHWLLAIAESNLKGLPKSDDKIIELVELKEQLKKFQIKSIINNWSIRQLQSARNAHSKGVNPISLFNKRGSRGERRNSLRKIINTDFSLFTDFFPVVMLSPTVCSSVIPLDEAIFDIVIFDEASQLRLEDTFPALLRGKIKVISGDSQQMPPSNFFQGGSALLNPTEEDYEEEQTASEIQTSNRNTNNSLDLADSESLLVYAENCNYKQSYLKVHYRSNHPHLIDFSNHAFYGKRLIPMPAKEDYIPIQFIEVNGLYEDQVNRDEARQVVDILLNHIKPFKSGKYPSVGVATFNLYQRNLILEEITKARQLKPEYDKKIADLGSDLFVKNLENIQGDERDIIILSTTFGRRADGSFRQQFGPILQRNGYKLLNVIVTRAKYKVYVCTSIPQEHFISYSKLLQQMKNNGRAVFYAYLAYAKSVSENNSETRKSLLKQLYENCESKTFEIDHDVYGSESPFEEEVYYRLAEMVGQGRLQQQFPIGGFRIDLIIKSKITGKPVIAIECDGAKYHSSNEAYAWDIFRQSRLEEQGFIFYRIWSTNWFNSVERELKKVVAFISQFDKDEKQVADKQLEEVFKVTEIIPITLRPEMKMKVGFGSTVTVKNPEGKILKVKFSKTQASRNIKPDNNGLITVYEKSPLALAIFGRTEGEACQLGMLELYYEILKIE
jgi:superfamily I DNA and/or RNA helicase/very-short-patch-repair endonuclease/transcription elongation GreA/GreB family factor